MAKKKKSSQEKIVGRNWTFEIYPESVDTNYVSILDMLHVAWSESPLHDKDINNNGEPKKAHRHIVLAFEGNKSYEQYLDIVKSVRGVPAPPDTAKVASIRGMVRYFIHRDNPEKAAYLQSDIVDHCGFDSSPYFQYAAHEVKKLLAEIFAFIDAYSILEFSDLMEYACKNYYESWFDLLTVGRQSWIVKCYIDSRRNSLKDDKKSES